MRCAIRLFRRKVNPRLLAWSFPLAGIGSAAGGDAGPPCRELAVLVCWRVGVLADRAQNRFRLHFMHAIWYHIKAVKWALHTILLLGLAHAGLANEVDLRADLANGLREAAKGPRAALFGTRLSQPRFRDLPRATPDHAVLQDLLINGNVTVNWRPTGRFERIIGKVQLDAGGLRGVLATQRTVPLPGWLNSLTQSNPESQPRPHNEHPAVPPLDLLAKAALTVTLGPR